MPPQAVTDEVTTYRVEGYAERVRFNVGNGNVSFAPGQYRVQLEIRDNDSAPGVAAKVTVEHTTADEPTEAIVFVTPDALATLKRDSYTRRIVVISPINEAIVIADGPLILL